MKSFSSILLFFFLYPTIQAQIPSIVWERSFGGTRGEFPYDMCITRDGLIVVCGSSNSVNYDLVCKSDSLNLDYWIFCVDTLGNLQWSNCFGGSLDDEAFAIDTTIDGGFIVAGYANSIDGDVAGNHGSGDYWVIKLNSLGDMVWSRCYGGSKSELAFDVTVVSDGGFLISGQSRSNDGDVSGHHGTDILLYDYWIVKTDSSGNIKWQKSLGGTENDYAMSGIEFSEGTYIVGGASKSSDGDLSFNCNPSGCYWIVMLDSIGNIFWDRALGGAGNDQCRKVLKTLDRKILCFGMSNSNDGLITDNHGGTDYLVVTLDSLGNILWSHSYGGAGEDLGRGIALVADSGFIATGLSQNSAGTGQVTNNYGKNDYWVIKTDINGNLEWEKNLGGSSDDIGSSCSIFKNRIYLSGFTASMDFDVSFNHNTDGFNGDVWLTKLDQNTGIESEHQETNLFTVVPNPADGYVKINVFQRNFNECKITDLNGKIKYQNTLTDKNEQIIDTRNLINGTYFIILISKEHVVTEKLFILHH